MTGLIETDRLILRRMMPFDRFELFEIMMDRDTAQLAGFRPMQGYDEASDLIRRWQTDALLDAWAIVEKDSGRLAGVLEEEFTGSGEKSVGYWLARWARGRGYMTEALKAARDRIFEEEDEYDTIRLFTFPRNVASAAVARKCGFFYDGTTLGTFTSETGDIEDLDHWSITREDWTWSRTA